MVARAEVCYEPEEAKELVLAGKARAPFYVNGALKLAGARQLKKLPRGLRCFDLDLTATALVELPEDLEVESVLTLRDCKSLRQLPRGLTVGTLDLQGCTALTELPEGLDVWFLNLRGCVALQGLPRSAKIRNGGLNLAGCRHVRHLPAYLTRLSTLDLSDCPLITALPPKLEVGLWIDVGGSGLTGLGPPNQGVGVRWRGVTVDHRVAFRPEELTAAEILEQKNAELRRVMIERMGVEKFMGEANAKVLDRDRDPGGPRELLRLPLKDDEDIVCLSCICPSTARRYLLRVPPNVKTCHQAAAWIAGFDDPADYHPVIET